METETKGNDYSPKRNIVQLIFIVIYLFILILLYYYIIQLGFNPLITLILIIFLFLIGFGLILKRKKWKISSKLFSSNNRRSSIYKEKIETRERLNREKIQLQPKIPKPIKLDDNYKKPLIKKCEGCGNILPNFIKKCPICNRPVT